MVDIIFFRYPGKHLALGNAKHHRLKYHRHHLQPPINKRQRPIPLITTLTILSNRKNRQHVYYGELQEAGEDRRRYAVTHTLLDPAKRTLLT